MPGLPSAMNADILIVGGGAAGLMCAIEAGKRGRKVIVLEHQDRLGKKILISGGGRCNFTNLYSQPENFLSKNAHFCKSALSRYKPADFLALIDKYRIEYYEKTLGQLFCKVSAKQVTEMLQKECAQAGVSIRLGCRIGGIQKTKSCFEIATDHGILAAPSVVIATGGLSYAKLGASDFGYRVAKQFGLEVHPPKPALVPLKWSEEDLARFGSLSGISFPGIVSCRKKHFREAVLFTHRGLSGPAVLQISSYWREGEEIEIDLLPDYDIAGWLLKLKSGGEKSQVKNLLAGLIPKRLAETWCETYFPSRPLNEVTDSQVKALSEKLHHWKIAPAATEGYETAEVTRGGIDTNELSSKTFESKKIPGLYFIGEVLDVTGHLGGHNFQWAWASGFAAGQAL